MASLKEKPVTDSCNKKQDEAFFIDAVPKADFDNSKSQQDSDDDLLDILIELSNSSNDCLPTEEFTKENENLDVSSIKQFPVEDFVLSEMIGEKLIRHRCDGEVFILNYMKKITKKGIVSFLKMKLDRPSEERLEFYFQDPDNVHLHRYYISYPLASNQNDKYINNKSEGLNEILENNGRFHWHNFSVQTCGSIIYIIKFHKTFGFLTDFQ